MAKLEMQKIELIALLTDSKKIVELLQRRGIVELSNCTDENLIKTNVTAVISEFDKFRNMAVTALEILNKKAPEKKSLLESFSGRDEIEKHDFGAQAVKLEKVMQGANLIIKNNQIISECEASLSHIDVRLDMLCHWINLDIPLNFKGTAHTVAFIGTFPKQYSKAELEEIFPEVCNIEIVSATKLQSNVFLIAEKKSSNEVLECLRQLAFTPISDPEDKTPADLQTDYEHQKLALNEKIEQCQAVIEKAAEHRRMLEFTIDYLQMRKDKYEALQSLAFSQNVFVLTGYIPKKYTQAIADEIHSKFTSDVRFYQPDEDDNVPVLLENSKFSEPVEGITEMYALPNSKDVDPTSVMAFFYYLFFGMMLSDAGYGLIMVIGTMIALKKLKLENSMRKTLTMFRNCGVSTVVFGALFGSWFGDIVQVVGREYFEREIGSIALWFQPLDDPIKLLLYSFALGIAHLFLGVAVSFKMRWSENKKLDAFLDTVPVYLTILGVCPIGASILTSVPATLVNIGKYVALVGVILLILTAGRGSKSVFGKFFGGLYALYNTATGYLSDILSYSRLLALGLATGSIAGVINLIGTMPENMVVKTIALIAVFVIGHTANLAINLLGAYVHTDRLQFVELFSKFYEGGGRAFNPFTVKTKYIKFKEDI